ncbi:LysR family transcriptional regulator [Xanthobacter sediminis]
MSQAFNWNDLQAFLAVARTGRLTEAARSMAIEHTTLSRRIARLEMVLATRLFDRRPTGYSLTTDGAALLSQAETMEATALGILSNQTDPRMALTGTIRVGTPEAFGTYCLGDRIGALAAAYPGLTLELVAMPRAFSLSKREADLAIGLSRPPSGRLHAQKLTDYELGLYGSPGYIESHGAPKDKSELASHRFVGYIDDLVFAPELEYFASTLPGLDPAVRISNIITQMQATIGGAGLCILPCFMADPAPRLKRLLPESVRLTRSYWLVHHSDLHDSPRIKVISKFICDTVRDKRAMFLPGRAPAGR